MKSIKNDFLTELSTKEKLNQLKTFFISFCMIIIAFGAKLVGNSYPSDDYFRIYNSENWYNQADRGRWFASILNSTIFNGWYRYFVVLQSGPFRRRGAARGVRLGKNHSVWNLVPTRGSPGVTSR